MGKNQSKPLYSQNTYLRCANISLIETLDTKLYLVLCYHYTVGSTCSAGCLRELTGVSSGAGNTYDSVALAFICEHGVSVAQPLVFFVVFCR